MRKYKISSNPGCVGMVIKLLTFLLAHRSESEAKGSEGKTRNVVAAGLATQYDSLFI